MTAFRSFAWSPHYLKEPCSEWRAEEAAPTGSTAAAGPQSDASNLIRKQTPWKTQRFGAVYMHVVICYNNTQYQVIYLKKTKQYIFYIIYIYINIQYISTIMI